MSDKTAEMDKEELFLFCAEQAECAVEIWEQQQKYITPDFFDKRHKVLMDELRGFCNAHGVKVLGLNSTQ